MIDHVAEEVRLFGDLTNFRFFDASLVEQFNFF